ncbi:hypothetical protein R77560_04566 [Ralstonia thomasii]|uniref:Uncharacterized protein n=1 Tax=Ralstonia thomasii TaxID=3058596 RepID=A0AAD2BUR4_9RALS|nr:hypothetical protein [Ralstonia sp. LMG 18095]CAJ0807370.1 hypothetical protein R77560_04566 [Ralstonia sp. LMG 18095]
MTDKNYTLLSSPPNRKEFAEAFGQNQAAVRRLENLTLDVTKNLPNGIDANTELIQFGIMNSHSVVAVPVQQALSGPLGMLFNACVSVPSKAQALAMFAMMESISRVGQTPGNYPLRQPLASFQSAQALGTSLTNGTTANVASLPLPAGTWDVSGVVVFNANSSTVIEQLTAGISSTSATLSTPDTYQQIPEALSTTTPANLQAPITRIVLASAATVYLVAQAIFTTSTMTADGYIKARPVL